MPETLTVGAGTPEATTGKLPTVPAVMVAVEAEVNVGRAESTTVV